MTDNITQAQGAAAIDLDKLADERALFEHAERASDLTRDDGDDYYLNPCVQSAWEGWRARAALARRATAPHAGPTDAQIIDAFDYQLAIDGDAHKAAVSTVRVLAAQPVEAAGSAAVDSKLQWHKDALDAVRRKLDSVWKGIEDAVEKYSGQPCEGEPFDRLDELLARLSATHPSEPVGGENAELTETLAKVRAWLEAHPVEPAGGALVASAESEVDQLVGARYALRWIADGQSDDPAKTAADALKIIDSLAAPAGALVAKSELDTLAEAIASAAIKRGIIKPEAALTGPQLVMLCDDLASESAAAPADPDTVRKEAYERAAALVLACHPKADRRGIAVAIRQLAQPTTQAEGK